MSLIELHDVVKSYQGTHALKGLTLNIPQGSLFGLLGPNGAGKSTLIRIICTLLAPDSGTVLVAGYDALTNPRQIREKLGYVAQEVAIDKILTGRELLQLQGDLYHLDRKTKKNRIEELVERLSMKDWIDRRCGSYSGGMRRRIDLASGLLHQPELLVLDEPTVGLDIESRSVIWELLVELKGKGTTILLTSHYLEEIDALADQMAIIDNGSVIAEGTPCKLKDQLGGDRVTLRVREFSTEKESEKVKMIIQKIYGVRQVVVNRAQGFSLNLVVDDESVLTKLKEELTKLEVDIFSLSQSRPSLDDVYLQATGRTLMDAELAIAGTRNLKSEIKQSM